MKIAQMGFGRWILKVCCYATKAKPAGYCDKGIYGVLETRVYAICRQKNARLKAGPITIKGG